MSLQLKKYMLIGVLFILIALPSCKKFIAIDPPINTITTGQVFSDNTQAEWALASVYSKLINGIGSNIGKVVHDENFAAGLTTIAGSLSADELISEGNNMHFYQFSNRLSLTQSAMPQKIWNSAYKTIYDANAVIEGLAAADPALVNDSIKKQLTGEALAIRAFCYFYLVNFFGDVPLALTIDFNVTTLKSRAPVSEVYQQIVTDLTTSTGLLSNDFKVGKGERVRINKWFAEAFLARVYLYKGNYQDAINSATNVINKTDFFTLENNTDSVFLKGSKEAIFQLKQTNQNATLKGSTPEGYAFNQYMAGANPVFRLTQELVGKFDVSDKRRNSWIGTINNLPYPRKYKIGSMNGIVNGNQEEYYTVMRLAELHLIRAEANIRLSPNNIIVAVDDVNMLRNRAKVPKLSYSISNQDLINAIAAERQLEFFAEWGHRWFDLKRTGKAGEVLSQIVYKQPWSGDYQLLYPIPEAEILANNRLDQNPEYNNKH